MSYLVKDWVNKPMCLPIIEPRLYLVCTYKLHQSIGERFETTFLFLVTGSRWVGEVWVPNDHRWWDLVFKWSEAKLSAFSLTAKPSIIRSRFLMINYSVKRPINYSWWRRSQVSSPQEIVFELLFMKPSKLLILRF